jgi:hypothetical protein
MKTKCVRAVATVYGREPTASEVRAIEERLSGAMRAQARRDPQAWLALSHDERVTQAARAAAKDLLEEAELATRRQALQVLAMSRLQERLAEFPGTPLEGLARLIAYHADARGSQQSLEFRGRAIKDDALRQMLDSLAATNPKFFGLFERPEGARDLVRELHGQATGNEVAAEGARQFRKIAEALRTRFNRGGGDIGKREDWGLPHHHSQVRVARAGMDAWRAGLGRRERVGDWIRDKAPPPGHARKTWVDEVMPALDRERYVRDDGTVMDDDELRELLGEIWTTIATGGLNKAEPGRAAGQGMAANRGNRARQLHFKSADAYLEYQAKYGEKPIYDVLLEHVERLSHDIAAVETFGPNPDHAFRLLRDQAVQRMTLEDPANAGQIRKKGNATENLFNIATGRVLPVASERVANFFDFMRNTLTANRLGSSVITALSDEATMMRIAAVNNLPQMQLWRNELAAFNLTNADEKRMAHRAGLGLNTLAHSVSRFGNDVVGVAWSGRVASATLRASGLNAMTDARRRAFGVTMMSAMGHISRQSARLSDLDPMDNRVLLSKGITDTDWEVWRRAELEDWTGGNDTMLTPDAIYRIPDERLADLGDPQALREEAVTKLLGTVLEETDMAIIEPGVKERAITRSNVQRGTISGELAISAWQFKTFPLSMLTKHWQRALSEPTRAGRVKALAALGTTTTIFGMLALQAATLRDGKDPRDMTDLRTWGAAMMKGGALSIFGDYLFSHESQSGRGLVASMLGPGISLLEETLALTWGNAIEAAQGEETDFGAEAARYFKHNTPGLSAVMNLWYTRAAVDHLVLHDLQELLSPGYLRRMENWAEREHGTTYWWAPGSDLLIEASGEDLAPERAPNFAKAIGKE